MISWFPTVFSWMTVCWLVQFYTQLHLKHRDYISNQCSQRLHDVKQLSHVATAFPAWHHRDSAQSPSSLYTCLTPPRPPPPPPHTHSHTHSLQAEQHDCELRRTDRLSQVAVGTLTVCCVESVQRGVGGVGGVWCRWRRHYSGLLQQSSRRIVVGSATAWLPGTGCEVLYKNDSAVERER